MGRKRIHPIPEPPKKKTTHFCNNLGMIMGKSICFAKYTHEHYTLVNLEEPSWFSKKEGACDYTTSAQVYAEYIKWLKN